MPVLWLPSDELEALQAVFRAAEEVNWEAYERARLYILQPQPEAPPEDSPVEC
jgi:hypothetical protein